MSFIYTFINTQVNCFCMIKLYMMISVNGIFTNSFLSKPECLLSQKAHFNSPKPWRVLIPSFSFLSFFLLLSAVCLLLLLTPFCLDQTFPKSFPKLGSAWLSLAQLGSAWLSLAQLKVSFLFYYGSNWPTPIATTIAYSDKHFWNLQAALGIYVSA